MAAPSTNLAVTEEPTTPDFAALHAYPFDSDPEFQAGLAHIVRQQAPGSEVSSTSSPELQGLVLQAKCFYYSRYVFGVLLKYISIWNRTMLTAIAESTIYNRL